jgi:TolB-like protein/DNA-binding winged helix-turn-helix (wHTH) protein/Tfp pilus assembly protein PilF
MAIASQTRRIRFGAFEVDLASSELFKHGIRIKLQDQPFQILTILLERPREVVSREELRRKLWAEDTFVDFDAGVNAAIRRLRDALNDSADQPRYIETLPRRGYRFVAKTETIPVEANPPTSIALPPTRTPDAPNPSARCLPPERSTITPPKETGVLLWLSAAAVTGGLIFLLVLGTGSWRHRNFRAHASTRIQSIAVLPLQNLSGDPAQEYFADGMTDALITNLAHISSLQVISRTSVMRYKNSREPLSKISKDLNVDAVVEGSVVRVGNRVRINTQVIQASTDRHIWASAFERDMSDVLTLQDEAAESIAREIATNLTPQDKVRLQDGKTVNPDAYEAYLQGKYFSAKQTDDGYEKAEEHYQRSIKIDPSYAPAYVGLGEVFSWLAYTDRQPPAEAWPKAEAFLTKALELDDTSSDAHVLFGMSRLLFHCDRAGADKELNRALELDPGNGSALDYHSYYLLEIGQTDKAIAEKKKVASRDPISVATNAELGLYFLNAERYDEAIEQLKKTLELDPNFAPTHMRLGLAYFHKGQTDEAIAEIKAGIAVEKTPARVGQLGSIYARSGRVQELPGVIRELEEMSKHRYVSASLMAAMYANLGNSERALALLEMANRNDAPGTDDSAFDRLRSNPRFKVMEARLKPEQFCAAR